jgi:hypothetical protein
MLQPQNDTAKATEAAFCAGSAAVTKADLIVRYNCTSITAQRPRKNVLFSMLAQWHIHRDAPPGAANREKP